jgi:RND family efflux transporter MFP subunit
VGDKFFLSRNRQHRSAKFNNPSIQMKRVYLLGSVLAGALVLYLLYHYLFAPPAVQTGMVTRGNLTTLVYATARVSADSLATLRSKYGGVVVEVLCREGVSVKPGALMLRTDPGEQLLHLQGSRNALATAEVHLADRTRDLERQRALFQARTVTRASYDDAQREHDLAQIAVERERINVGLESQKLRDTEIRAPFGGIVIKSTTHPGDLLSANAECFQLMAPGSLTIEADVAEQDISRLSPQQKCIVAFDAYPQLRFNGILERLIPLTDEATKTSRAVLRLDQPPENLTVGMTATVNVITEELHNVLLLPQAAVQETAGRKRVFTVGDGRVKVAPVETGTSDGTVAHLTGQSALPESTLVVLHPESGLTDGMRVHIE